MLPIPVCFSCKHYKGSLQCTAFPEGIPRSIVMRKHTHEEEYPGDNGIRYEPKEEPERQPEDTS